MHGLWTLDPATGGGGGLRPIWPATSLLERSRTAQHLHVSTLAQSIAAADNELQNLVYPLWNLNWTASLGPMLNLDPEPGTLDAATDQYGLPRAC